MQRNKSIGILTGAVAATLAGQSWAQSVQINDILLGLNRTSAAQTMMHIRGPQVNPGDSRIASAWNQGFIQSIAFDNNDGFSHAWDGNMLGMNFGALATGGEIYNMQTRSSTAAGITQKIFDFTTYNGANPALTISRLSGLSVSPLNNRIAVTGNDSGRLYVFDYNGGATPGTGAGAPLMTNGREANILVAGISNSMGTAWLDNDFVLSTDNNGNVHRTQVTGAGLINDTVVATLAFDSPGNSTFTSILYQPTMSPYVYVSQGQAPGNISQNQLFVLDPNNNFAQVASLDYTTTSNTMREMAFDAGGNLYWTQFGNATTSNPFGVVVQRVTGGNILANLGAGNNSAIYFSLPQTGEPTYSHAFTGNDIASAMLDYRTAGLTVDMRNKSVTVPYFPGTVGDPTNDIKARLATGWNGGDWLGTGSAIRSSTAAADASGLTAIGYAYASELGLVGSSFGGVTVPADAVLLKYTWYGDTDLNGSVDFDDYVRTDAGYNGGLTGWINGDFDYNDVVDFDDYVRIDSSYNGQTGTLINAMNWLTGDDRSAANASLPGVQKVIEHFEQFGLDYANAFIAAVPEPTTIGVLGIAGIGLLRRRRGN